MGHGDRNHSGHVGQGVDELLRGAQRRVSALGEGRATDDGVEDVGNARNHLGGFARPSGDDRGGTQRGGFWPRPVAGERGVQQSAQSLGVGALRVVDGDVVQGSVEAETDHLDGAADAPHQFVRG